MVWLWRTGSAPWPMHPGFLARRQTFGFGCHGLHHSDRFICGDFQSVGGICRWTGCRQEVSEIRRTVCSLRLSATGGQNARANGRIHDLLSQWSGPESHWTFGRPNWVSFFYSSRSVCSFNVLTPFFFTRLFCSRRQRRVAIPAQQFLILVFNPRDLHYRGWKENRIITVISFQVYS